MPEQRNIVVLGVSYAGLRFSHYFPRHVYPHLPPESGIKYKVILVDPSSKFLARHVTPRTIARPDLAPFDKILLDIEPGFQQYGDKVSFVQGKATSWDDKARMVTIELADGKTEVLAYWTLVLATGTKTSPLHSLQGGDYRDVVDALKAVHSQLPSAKKIIVVGGGASGVETAGELGDHLNGSAGWFSARPSYPQAEITLITSSSKLLPQLRQSISDQAETYLNRVGVDVRYNTKLYEQKALPNGKTKAILHDGEELEADIVISTIGVKPMTEYVPERLNDAKGYVMQNNETLRVEKAGSRVYAVGDVGTYSDNSIIAIMFSVPVAATNLKRDLLAAHSDPNALPTGKDRLYKPLGKEMQLVPVGRSKGVGAAFGWRVPSWFVWMIKGRDFLIDKSADRINGNEVAKESAWKDA